MDFHLDSIKRRMGLLGIAAFVLLCPVAATAYTTGRPSFEGYVNSQTIRGVTWHMGATTMGNNGTGAFPNAVRLLKGTYSDPSKVANLSIPSSLTWYSYYSESTAGGRTIQVTAMASGAFLNCPHVTTVTIPSTITTVYVPCFRGCSNLLSITVSPAQVTATYASENGVLFRNDKYQKTKLVKYPEGKTGTSYAVPATVTNLADYCFANTKLSTIVFSGSPPPTVASTAFSGSGASVLYPQGASGWTSPWYGVDTYAIPNAVKGLKATQGTSQTQVTVTWTANAVAKSYVVYRAESAGGSKVTLGTIGSGSTVFSDTTATAGKTYYYWVKAVNGPAESGLGSYVQGWKAGSYTVALDTQGGTGGTASVTATYGAAMPKITVPSRPGYTFGGYYTTANGGGTQYYTDTGTSARTWDKTAAATLYAKWTGNSYSVTLDAREGFGGSASVTATYGEAMPFIAVPTRTGYTFDGYYTATNGGGTQYYTADGTSARTWNKTAATTLYAKWTGNSYTVTLDAQKGSGGTASVTATYGAAMPMIAIPSRGLLDFGGYYSEPGGGGTQYYTAIGTSAHAWDVASASTLYAKWTGLILCSTITLDVQGGSGGTASVTASYGEAMPSIVVPTRTGYTFGGYYTAINGGGTQYYTVDGTSARNWDRTATTLYAQWTGNSYTVTLDARNGSGGTASVTATYGEAMPSIAVPSLDGRIFGGYYSAPDGAGMQYYTAVGTTAHAWDQAADGTLYAQWMQDPTWRYTLSNGTAIVTGVSSANGALAIPSTLGGCPVMAIGTNAFQGCTNLTSVTIGDRVTSIGTYAFYGCNDLKTLYAPESWKTKYVGGQFWSSYASVPSGCEIIYYGPPKTSTGVPYAWLEEHGLGDGTAEGYEAAAAADAANRTYTVADCYVAGLSPTNPTAEFKVKSLFIENGEPVVEWEPDLNENGTKTNRTYRVEGKPTLTNEWLPADTNSRFFRVWVGLPSK